MKTTPKSSARVTVATLLLIAAIALLSAVPFLNSRAQSPAAGTISPTSSAPVTWTGTTISPGGNTGEDSCIDSGPGQSCETYTLTVSGAKADWAGKRVRVLLTWQEAANEYDIYIHKGSNTGPVVASAIQGPGMTQQVAFIDVGQFGTGVFTVHVAYDATPASAADEYHGAASVVPEVAPPPPPAPADNGPKIGFELFEAPGVLTPVTTTTGPNVEYMGRGAGEPSIGVNWNTNVTNFQSDLETLFITFANGCPAAGSLASWVNRPAPTSQLIDSDPIGFTDRQTGRTFAAELTATSPTCKISYTDDDGKTWVPSPGTVGSGIDHETIGGGPYHAPVPTGLVYPNAVYYCSQDLVTAFCLRSDDGGQTYGPPSPTYTTECGGLHGHVKVSPKDGTVYLPNNACGGEGAVVVSEDNGTTWNVRPVKSSTYDTISGASDPAVGIDKNGRVYFAMASADSSAVVGTSDDDGVTWKNLVDVGAAYGLHNIRYPAAVGGDAGRAAVAFYGTTTGGNANAAKFNGVWHLYVAETFDGGLTWTTTDATPNAPLQRGPIWTGGGANISRNLLDFFDIAIDKQGRVQVGYVNGCPGGNCAQAAPTASGNGYAATATIARQSSGRRLLAAFDPPQAQTAKSVPGIPFVTVRRAGEVVHLAWSEGDTGNSPITSYEILRGTSANHEAATPIATVAGDETSYDDTTASDPTKTYYYKVRAVNAIGSSCDANEVAAEYVGDSCNGIVIHRNDPSHPESAAANANPALAIDYIAVGEPEGTDNFLFTMKVADLSTVPPNSRWRIVWDSFASPGQQFYVGMSTDANGVPSFTYGSVATAVVGLVVGVPEETQLGKALAASHFKPDGTISIYVPKSKVGKPRPGDLLGAVNGRTFADNTKVERSTALIDHTFVKAQTDNAYPPATYTVSGNSSCGGQLLNISTRQEVSLGEKVSIGGFIISGTAPKTVLLRGMGPSLSARGVTGVLQNPTLELHEPDGTVVRNDDWNDTNAAAIKATGLAPKHDTESAILETLQPGAYTVVLAGKNDSSGVGLVEVYDLDQASNSALRNISTRGFVDKGQQVMIGGFIVGAGRSAGAANVVVRALGPSLSGAGVADPLSDPELELHDASGTTIATNDNWQSDPGAAQIKKDHLAPPKPKEAATIQTLAPGAYTVVVRGVDNTTGVGLVEAYDVP